LGIVIIRAIRFGANLKTPTWNAMKKSEVVPVAERQITATGWASRPLFAPAAPSEELEAAA
jgi:hypothetical protein